MRRLHIALVMVAMIAVGCVEEAADVGYRYQVVPTALWGPTGVMLAAGQHFEIFASGAVNIGAAEGPVSGASFDPNGHSGWVGGTQDWPGEALTAYALIGRIGSGVPFLVGTQYEGSADADGELQLTINEYPPYGGWPGLSDNTGSWEAEIRY